MPKAIAHWLIAEKTAERLKDTELGGAMRAHPNALRLGAVFPDLPYFLRGKEPWINRCRVMGNEWHGSGGEDTHRLLRRILAMRPPGAGLTPPQQAFLAGVASHLRADIAFHPLVYHLTGNYYDPDPAKRSRAVRNHRRLETLLDMRVCGGLKNVPSYSARAIASRLECEYRELTAWARREGEPPELEEGLNRALRDFLELQSWFIRPWAARLAGALDSVAPDNARELAALFYMPKLALHLPRLSSPLRYQNPVTGQSEAATVDELAARAVEESVALCRRLEPMAARGEPGEFSEPGPSLNFGLAGAAVSEARFFSATPFFED